MGLIKTAIYGGAGIFAINKLAKVAENRRNDNQGPRDNNQHDTQNAYVRDFNPQQLYLQAPQQGSYDQSQRHVKPEEYNPPPYYQNNARKMVESGAQGSSSGIVGEVVEVISSFSGKK